MNKERLLAGLQKAMDKACQLDPQLPHLLKPLVGKTIQLELRYVSFPIVFLIEADRIQISQDALEADLILRGSPFSFMRMALQETKDLSSLSISLQGDAGLAQQLIAVLQRLDIDWEAHIAKFTGERLAHRVGRGASRFKSWLGRRQKTFSDHMKSYLQEEILILPTADEVNLWLDQVDVLRDDAERLLLRWQQYQGRT